VSGVEKVRDGVVIKVKRSTHEKLNRIMGDCLSKLGMKVTYSDIIDALIESSRDPLNAVKRRIRG